MNILVCVKRVPETGARIVLTEDGQRIDTRYLGFTVSPHEECAVEEAVRQIEKHGGQSTVLTLGPPEAVEQLRAAMSIGIDSAILLETDGEEWPPMPTAEAIVEAIRQQAEAGNTFDLLLFGNESADAGGYQVGVRVAQALDLPCVTGIKALEIRDGVAVVRREAGGFWEVFEVPLPAVLTIKEGINVPRYPSLPGRLRAKKKPVLEIKVGTRAGGLQKIRLRTPEEEASQVQILGEGPEAAPKVVDLLEELGLIPS
ncbi:MAG: electron transfer flavoprotein beta subunit/FixA family protein [Caldilineae bacterium]|nr:MAG: electron transfer flavoprotein beta subunit/FixA family protein [Caldilineae bacterium]